MKANIFITGMNTVSKNLKMEKDFNCQVIENPYNLRAALSQTEGEKIIVAYLPFLEIRHFDLYMFLQRTIRNLKTVFVVNELSDSMKLKIKSNHDFIVLWKTEENSIAQNIHHYLDGKTVELRQDKREPYEMRPLVSPSLLPSGLENRSFQPILGGSFENLSSHGSCLKIRAPFYSKKDFVHLSYQDKAGEYISLEGQVRWTKWNATEETQELGVQFVTQASTQSNAEQ